MSEKFKTKLIIVLIGLLFYILSPTGMPLHSLGVCMLIGVGIWMWTDILKNG